MSLSVRDETGRLTATCPAVPSATMGYLVNSAVMCTLLLNCALVIL